MSRTLAEVDVGGTPNMQYVFDVDPKSSPGSTYLHVIVDGELRKSDFFADPEISERFDGEKVFIEIESDAGLTADITIECRTPVESVDIIDREVTLGGFDTLVADLRPGTSEVLVT